MRLPDFNSSPVRAAVTVLVVLACCGQAAATPSASTHFRLDPNVGSSFGGQLSATDYRLTDAGGEAAVGASSSPSYQLGAGYVAQLSQSIQLSILPSGIVAYYPLDTGQGGQVYDVSANNNQGVLKNSPSWTAGKLGSGLALNGSSQYAAVPSSSNLNLTGDMTITAWVKLTDYTVQHEIVSKRVGTGATNTTYELRVQQTTGQLQFLSYDGSLKTLTGSTPVPTGSWAQVAIVKQSGQATLYLNGAAISSALAIGTPSTSTNDLTIGSNDDLTNFFKGSIDEVKLYNRAVSASELLADVAAVNAGAESTQAIPSVLPGISQSVSSDAVVRTDAPSYDLAIAQNHDLQHTDGTTTIPAISPSITSPSSWSEGTTKGLGFTVTAGSGIEAKWGTGPNFAYAALPAVSTTFHSRSGFGGGSADVTTMQYRLDTLTSQKSGSYSNTVTLTATLKP